MQPSAIRVVVCDSGPLIALGRLKKLAILVDVFREVQVPRDVLAECLRRPELPDAQAIQAAVASGILLLCDATPIRVDGLGAGESAAIGRAMEIGAALMADDLAARHHAANLGLTVIDAGRAGASEAAAVAAGRTTADRTIARQRPPTGALCDRRCVASRR